MVGLARDHSVPHPDSSSPLVGGSHLYSNIRFPGVGNNQYSIRIN